MQPQTHIQIRNVPDPVHRALKSRAALAGMSLSDYLRVELTRLAQVPTVEEFQARLQGRAPAPLVGGASGWVQAEREDREVWLAAEPPPPPYGDDR